jgi:hypothetical protein
VRAIEEIERQRWADQLRRRQADLAADERLVAEGRACVARSRAIELTRRDLALLDAALQGRMPSAVVGRPDPGPNEADEARRRLARDEAWHVADNAIVYLRRLADASDRDAEEMARRAARWLLRLDVELDDADLPTPTPAPREAALCLLEGAGPPDRGREIHEGLAAWRSGPGA